MKNLELLSRPADAVSVRTRTRPIGSPSKMKSMLPLSYRGTETVNRTRRDAQRILSGEDDHRLILLCGPCSIHDTEAALEYALKLSGLAAAYRDRLLVIMRVYFEKPRTTLGWKGMIYDEDCSGLPASPSGLGKARELLLDISRMGVPCATEFLNPIVATYLDDCIAYGSIGARTAESQIHRELASVLEMPVGIKNGTDGSLASAINAVIAARQPHSAFAFDQDGRPAIVETRGNPYAHVCLRGGRSGSNMNLAAVDEVERQLPKGPLKRPIVMDCSHANSEKDFRRQKSNAFDVARMFARGASSIAGLMIESHLIEGSQPLEAGRPLVYGQSITDGCIGWEETEQLVGEIASVLK